MNQHPLSWETLAALFELRPQACRSVACVRGLRFCWAGSATAADMAAAIAAARAESGSNGVEGAVKERPGRGSILPGQKPLVCTWTGTKGVG